MDFSCNRNKSLVFISGMYRSGTTLIARLLQARSDTICASDPIRPFFNSYSNFLRYKDKLNDSQLFLPFSDLFLEKNIYFESLINSDFKESIDLELIKLIKKQVIAQSLPYSPLFSKKVSESKSINSIDTLIFSSGFNLMSHSPSCVAT